MIYFLFLDVSPTFVTSGLDISLILVAIVWDKIVPLDEHVFLLFRICYCCGMPILVSIVIRVSMN